MKKYQILTGLTALLIISAGFFILNNSSGKEKFPSASENLLVKASASSVRQASSTAPTAPAQTPLPIKPEAPAQANIKKQPPKQAAKPQAPGPAPKPAPPADNCEAGNFDQQFLCLINNHRVLNGKGLLAYDSKLNQTAASHSAWMSSAGILSHTGENGSVFTERCAQAGATCWAENLAFGFRSASYLFEMWKASPGHNTNMLGPYSALGLGIAGGYATTVFR